MDVIDENEIKNCQIVSLLHKPIKRASLYSTIEDVVYGEVKKQKTSAKENKTVKKLHKKLKVLLAEDNVINQKVAVYNLEDWGHEVEVAENGEIAFQKYKNEAYDLILMDIQMPILDGLKATKKIREYEKERGKTAVKIVAMTANALKGDDQICYDAGMDAYISKPFKREDFENLINS
jgi:CheY-like chemotaxis protein